MIDLQLFPCVDYFKILANEKNAEIFIYDRFRKMSFHNRFVLAGANGIVHLTIPIKGGREQKKLITEVEIDHSFDWQKKHWRTLVSGYAKAPFFDYYSEEIRTLLFNRENNLTNYNIYILRKICSWLKISVVVNEIGQVFTTDEDYRNTILPRNFQNDAATWKPTYPQVFEDKIGFQPNLSILDLLLNVGPASRDLLVNDTK